MENRRDLTIRGATIVTCDPAGTVLQGDVVASEGKIAALGLGLPPRGKIIDAGGKLLLPGLIQAHVHLCQTAFRGAADGLDLLPWLRERIWPLEADLTPESTRASAELGLKEMLLSGVTTVCTMETVHFTDVILDACLKAGVRAVIGKALMDQGDGIPPKLQQSADAAFEELEDLLSRYHGADEGRLRLSVAPRFVLSCSQDLLRQAADFARRHDLVIHTHAAENQAEVEEAKNCGGYGNIEFLHKIGCLTPRTILAHVVWSTPDELDLIQSSGSRVVHCPMANLKLGSGIAPVPAMVQRGIPLGLGSDGAACNNALDIWQEMKLAALIASLKFGPAALAPSEVLKMAIRGGAEAIGLGGEIGSIEVGKRADLILVDTDKPHWQGQGDWASRIVYSGRAADVELVMVDGRLLVERGELL